MRTYDIVNAGPKNRFMANGRIVSNSGRLVQLQNLPQNHIPDLAWARDRVKDRDGEMLEMMYGIPVPDALSQLIRTCFVPPKGKAYVIADFSAIEARTLAWIAGEQWVLDTFRNGGDIYCATASQMFGVPVEKHGQNSELRQKGKIAVLALGYNGGEHALEAMGALRMGIKPEELTDIKTRWRKANSHIVALWGRLNRAVEALMETREPQYLPKGMVMRIEDDKPTGQEAMTIQLPSGRKLFYAHPFMAPAPRFPDRMSLHFYGQNQMTKKWEVVETHGGKLVENCIAEGMLVATARGLTPIQDIRIDDAIWDGEAFVRHEGLICKGKQDTIFVDGVECTPDHKILTAEKGWVRANEAEGLNWAYVRSPYGDQLSGAEREGKVAVEIQVPMRERNRTGGEGRYKIDESDEILRMPAAGDREQPTAHARYVEASGVRCLALDGTALHGADAQGLEELRRQRDIGVRQVETQLRGVLGGYEPDVQTGAGSGQKGQRARILPGELSLGRPEDKQQEPTEQQICDRERRADNGSSTEREIRDRRDYAAVQAGSRLAGAIAVDRTKRSECVYDIRNCGPRHRFAVYDEINGRLRIVSNCTQAIARDLLCSVMSRMASLGYPPVFHVHDELIVEAFEADKDHVLQCMLDEMATPPKWAYDLPLKGAGFTASFYQKD